MSFQYYFRSSLCTYHITEYSYKDCEPRNKIAFLKTHKCASTSIQNILLRFGRKNNLNFVLPSKGHNLGYPGGFHRSIIKGTLWEQAELNYDMFLLHTRWDSQEISRVLNDQGDVLYVSILRDPVELFRSWWDYLKLDKRHNSTLEQYARTVAGAGGEIGSPAKRPYGFNQMLWDFGMDYKSMSDVEKVKRMIQEIDETFDMILIADDDSFDDSIILLKDVLCWDYRDMINFKLNSKKAEMKSTLSPTARMLLKGKFCQHV